jgi:hypothetical protein
LRIRETVERVRKRFLPGGIASLPPHTAPGRTPTVTPEWQAALLRVLDLDPHTVGSPGPMGRPACWPRIWLPSPRWRSPPRPCAYICVPLAESANVRLGRANATPQNNRATWATSAGGGKLGRGRYADASTRTRSCGGRSPGGSTARPGRTAGSPAARSLQDEGQLTFPPPLTRVGAGQVGAGRGWSRPPAPTTRAMAAASAMGVRAGLTAAWPQDAPRISWVPRGGPPWPGRVP